MRHALSRPGAVARWLEPKGQELLAVAHEGRPGEVIQQPVKPLQDPRTSNAPVSPKRGGGIRAGASAYLHGSVVDGAGLAAALDLPAVAVEVLPEPARRVRRCHVHERVALVGQGPGGQIAGKQGDESGSRIPSSDGRSKFD